MSKPQVPVKLHLGSLKCPLIVIKWQSLTLRLPSVYACANLCYINTNSLHQAPDKSFWPGKTRNGVDDMMNASHEWRTSVIWA